MRHSRRRHARPGSPRADCSITSPRRRPSRGASSTVSGGWWMSTSRPSRRAEEGPVAYFLRSSVMQNDPLDRALIATSRLAQGGSTAASASAARHPAALGGRAPSAHEGRRRAQPRDARQRRPLLQQRPRGRSIPGPVPEGADMDALIALVEGRARRRGTRRPCRPASPARPRTMPALPRTIRRQTHPPQLQQEGTVRCDRAVRRPGARPGSSHDARRRERTRARPSPTRSYR